MIKDWFRDNRLETGSEESLPFSIAGEPRQRYGRDIAVPGHGSDRQETLDAVDRTHADIEHQQVRLGRLKSRERLCSATVTQDMIFLAEDERENVQVILVILNEEQPWRPYDLTLQMGPISPHPIKRQIGPFGFVN